MGMRKKRGRPRKLTPALEARFLWLYSNSTRSVCEIAAELGITDRTIQRESWRSPHFFQRYMHAREAHAEYFWRQIEPHG